MPSEDRILAEYLRRSYHAVDGLWFVTAEKAEGFDGALEMDRQVWEVLAKIQARKSRELLEVAGNGPVELARCFALKLSADGHRFTTEIGEHEVRFGIMDCPWLALLRKSDRADLASRIAQTICPTEGRVWCAEFGGEYEFAMPRMACSGANGCEMVFTRKSQG